MSPEQFFLQWSLQFDAAQSGLSQQPAKRIQIGDMYKNRRTYNVILNWLQTRLCSGARIRHGFWKSKFPWPIHSSPSKLLKNTAIFNPFIHLVSCSHWRHWDFEGRCLCAFAHIYFQGLRRNAVLKSLSWLSPWSVVARWQWYGPAFQKYKAPLAPLHKLFKCTWCIESNQTHLRSKAFLNLLVKVLDLLFCTQDPILK